MDETCSNPRLRWLDTLANILGRALVIAVISELVFINEGPVLAVVRPDDAVQQLLGLAELPLFYLVPAGLLYALESRATGWATVILLGALVGWSIEGALVPAVYEAPPFSFLWTSAAWHAPIDVALGLFVVPRLLARGRVTPKGAIFAAGLGLAWAYWATWNWPDLMFSLPEFVWLAFVVLIGLWAGYALAFGHGAGRRCSKPLAGVFVLTNIGLGLLWAPMVPVFAGLLAVLIALSVFALWKGSSGQAPLERRTVSPRITLVYLVIFGTAAIAGYSGLLGFGALLAGPDVVLTAVLPGSLLWSAALIAALLSQSGKNRRLLA